MTTTKLARQIYAKILRSGVVRRATGLGIWTGSAMTIAALVLGDTFIPDESAWYIYAVFGAVYYVAMKITGYLTTRYLIWSIERAIGDGTQG